MSVYNLMLGVTWQIHSRLFLKREQLLRNSWTNAGKLFLAVKLECSLSSLAFAKIVLAFAQNGLGLCTERFWPLHRTVLAFA